jgi:hypothetical protein
MEKITYRGTTCIVHFNIIRSRDSSVVQRWPTGWMIGSSRPGRGWEFFTTASKSPGALSLGIKRPGRETDQSSPSSTEVKECVELYLNSPNIPSWCGAQFKEKAQGQIFLYVYGTLHTWVTVRILNINEITWQVALHLHTMTTGRPRSIGHARRWAVNTTAVYSLQTSNLHAQKILEYLYHSNHERL